MPDTAGRPTRLLDPELRRILARLPAGEAPGSFDDMEVVRALRDTLGMLRAMGRDLPADTAVTVTDRAVPGRDPGASLPLRCYTPEDHQGGLLLFFHGGGYVIGDLHTEEQRCLELARHGQCAVVSVGYALAPEEPYPAALDDALAARERGGPAIAFQLLVYPMLDDRMDSASMRDSDGMALFDRRAAAQAWRHYLGGRPADHYAAPARAEDLSGLPPAYVLAAEHDPLRDEDVEFARRLAECGVPTELHLFPGTFHGFDLVGVRTSVGRRALEEQCAALRRALTPAAEERAR